MLKKLYGFLFAVSLVACGGAGSQGNEGGAGSTDPPPPVEGNPLCILSADCPDGQHCDLGECVQDCNTEDPCSGELTCSPRARCVKDLKDDKDVVSESKSAGTVSVEPKMAQLLDSEGSLELTLSATSSESIPYRVTVDADFLGAPQLRSEFTGSTKLAFPLDPAKITGSDAAGSIKIFTSLGDVLVPVVVKKSITGRYQGAMRYTVNGISLGDARLSAQIISKNGDLSVLFDPESSLLFPDSGAGPTTGVGTFDETAGGSFTVQQRVNKTIGGDRNHFARDLGRRIVFNIKKNTLGGFDGTFTEKIYGLLDTPIELEGQIFLRRRTGEEPPKFELSPDTQMPAFALPALADFTNQFGSSQTCASTMTAVYAGFSIANTTSQNAIRGMSQLRTTVANRTTNAVTFSNIRQNCENELHLPSKPASVTCAWQPALVCASGYAAGAYGGANYDALFQEFFVGALEPSILVAQDYAVKALDDSLGAGGLSKERNSYTSAEAELAPLLAWALHPSIAGYLSGLPVEKAKGVDPAVGDKDSLTQTFPAARTLARLLQIAGTVDGEVSRLAAVEALSSDTALVKDAQSRALLGLLEGAVLLQMTKNWGITPDMIGADLSGFLSPLDGGFGALLEGARSFGIPDGYVPFVWRAEDVAAGSSNFEQMLTLAQKAVASHEKLEAAYVANKRIFEDSESAMLKEALDISSTYDAQIKELCGSSFDLTKVKSNSDFANCGKNNSGEVGSALLAIAQADQRIAEHESRIRGLIDKYSISERALSETQAARGKTLDFMSANGEQINGMRLATSGLDLAMTCIQTASQSGWTNFGGPAVGAAAMAILGVVKLGLEQQIGNLQLMQDLALPALEGEVELINGMAELKRQLIDIGQAEMELTSFTLEKQQSAIAVSNLVERAKSLYDLRTRAQAIAQLDPTRDPSYRLIRDHLGLQLLDSRARVQKLLFLAGRALEYEVNTPIPSLSSAVLSARSSLAMEQLAGCFGTDIMGSYRLAFGSPQKYTTEVSVREMLGITGERTDAVTGEVLSPGQQFRLYTQKNQFFDGDGGLTIEFGTNLQPNNGLWSSDVCGDRISGIQAQLVGDNLGDNEAQVNIALGGAAVLRECDSDNVRVWSMGEGVAGSSAKAVVQAGVNSYGTTTSNTSLFGQSVARATWQISIPGPSGAPSNSDISCEGLEDIILKIEHQAAPRRETPLYVDLSCLSSIN